MKWMQAFAATKLKLFSSVVPLASKDCECLEDHCCQWLSHITTVRTVALMTFFPKDQKVVMICMLILQDLYCYRCKILD